MLVLIPFVFLPSILSQIIYFSAEKDEITDDKVKRESGDSDGSDSDSDDDADVSKVCMISYKGLPG